MYSSRELIDVLLARGRRGPSPSGRRVAERPPGEFPPGWRAWFASMHARAGAVTGATAEAIVAVFLQREPARPAPRSPELSNWQAFAALWRQQWHASGQEPAHERVVAVTVTLLVHLVLALLLLWMMYVRFVGAPAPAGEDVIQVEYVGEGTPEDAGGGAPAAETAVDLPEAPAEDAAAAPPPTAAVPAPPAPAERPKIPGEPVPQPPPEAPAPQPLQVTETPTPDSDFVLPPTTPPELEQAAPEVRRPVMRTVERAIELAETPTPPAVRPELAQRPSQPVQLQPRPTPLQAREVPLLIRPAPVPEVAQPPQPAPQVRAPSRQVRPREIPLASSGAQQTAQPQPAAPGQAAPTSATRAGAASPSAAAPASGRPADTSGDRPAATAGRGASPGAPPGAWPTPRRGDDWGESDRNRPGGNAGTQSGLFDADGRPKLPPGTAAPGGGFPPGGDDWTREQLDRYGTWATRPPLGYEPTRFDQYWIPRGSLLEEWVRRGIKNMSIPIPGTSKKISCVISILQLGGGCGITDPNLSDQEAAARPPPDIPYKPELQEPER